MIWPRNHTFRILAAEGQPAALAELEQMLARSTTADTLQDCRTFAAEIIKHWLPRKRAPAGQAAYPARMLEVLDRLGAAELAEKFIRDVLPKDFDGTEGKALLRLCQRCDWNQLGVPLRALIEQQKPEDYGTRLEPIVALCQPLCCDPPPLTPDRRAVCASLAGALAEAIERWDKKTTRMYGINDSRAGVVASMVQICAVVSAHTQLDWFLAHALADKQHYDLRQVLIPDVKAIFAWPGDVAAAKAAAGKLLEHCQGELRAATATPVEPPPDWTRAAELGCKCEDCQALARFLRDPAARVGRFSIRQGRRQHLEQQITQHRGDCTHVTERKGSPQTLVCTKTQDSYERRLKQYQTDQQLLAELNSLSSTPAGALAAPHFKTAKRTSKK